MEYSVIHSDKVKGIEIRDYGAPTQEVYDLIASQVWGTSGPIFTKHHTREKLDGAINPHFLLVYNNEEVFIGMCVVSVRPTGFLGEFIDAYYLQFFSMKPAYQGQGIGKWFLEECRKYFNRIIVKPTVSYATIEGKNYRSSRVADFIKYDFVNHVNTCIFSRLYPKKTLGVSSLTVSQKEDMVKKLEAFYDDHCFVHFQYLNGPHPYLVLRENDEIVAGLLVHRQFWEFKSLPGIQGKVIMNVVPKLPVLNRVFNPKYKFIVFEAMYYKVGFEHKLIELMEHALAEFEVGSAMTWLDPRGKVFNAIDTRTSFGIIDKLEGKLPVSTYAHLHHNTPLSWEEMKEAPIYIASYDCV